MRVFNRVRNAKVIRVPICKPQTAGRTKRSRGRMSRKDRARVNGSHATPRCHSDPHSYVHLRARDRYRVHTSRGSHWLIWFIPTAELRWYSSRCFSLSIYRARIHFDATKYRARHHRTAAHCTPLHSAHFSLTAIPKTPPPLRLLIACFVCCVNECVRRVVI